MRRIAIHLMSLAILTAPCFFLLSAGCIVDQRGHGPDADHHPDDHGQIDNHGGDAPNQDHR